MAYDNGEKRHDPMAAGRAVFAKRVGVLLLTGLVLLWLAAACGRLGPYVDVPSLLGVGVLWLLGMALGVGLGNVCRAFGVLTWVEDQDVSLAEAKRHARVWRHGRATAWGAGAVVALVGWIAMALDLRDWGFLGQALGIALLSVLYALVWAELVCRPLAVIAEGVVGRLGDGE